MPPISWCSRINPEALGYDSARAALLRDKLVTGIRAVPGVVGSTTSGPFWRSAWFGRLFIDGEARRLGRHMGGAPNPHWLPVRHDFFETLGLPVVAGRGLPNPTKTSGQPMSRSLT